MRSPASFAAGLLTNRIVDVGARPLTAREFWRTFTSDSKLELIEEMDVEALCSHLFVNAEMGDRLRQLLDASRAYAFELEQLEEGGVRVLTALDEGFPPQLRETLGEQCPVALLVAGPVEWLSDAGVGVVGSRSVAPEVMEAAASISTAIVQGGFGVTSGLARGIDQIAMQAGLEAGGRVCGIPAEGIRRVSRRADVRAAVHDGALALASPYGPDAPFSVGSAMGRNKLIYGLSAMTVVVTSDKGSGGTWSGATEALEKGYGHVRVYEGSGVGEGNSALIRAGAQGFSDPRDARWLSTPSEPPQGRKEPGFEEQRLF